MELYRERGFENTTVEEIAGRAGLTERTFFRHFADKREVLFGGAGVLQEFLVTQTLDAPADLPPLEAVTLALMESGEVIFEERHEFAKLRQAIILANAELQERELIKLAHLATALADALRQRGVTDPVARRWPPRRGSPRSGSPSRVGSRTPPASGSRSSFEIRSTRSRRRRPPPEPKGQSLLQALVTR